MSGRHILSLAALALLSSPARADLLVRIGDEDGFGYRNARGLKAADGGPANRSSQDPAAPRVLGQGDYLPDINQNGHVRTGNGDDFDLRSAAEVAGTSYTIGAGVTGAAGTTGSQFTDISLSTSYHDSQVNDSVLIGRNPTDGLVFGAGGPFPSPPSTDLPNQPGFVFQFSVDKAALSNASPIYFNMIFGDYEVRPARIAITNANGDSQFLPLTVQPPGNDGLIQAAYATLNFGDLFADGGSVWNGYLKIDFDAPREPYTAFDYVELSTDPIAIAPVPEPASLAMLGVGAPAALGVARRRKPAAR
jgi:hypothetical protein